MDENQQPVSFYWVPGCANCTRLKGYLARRDVIYDAINVLADPDLMDMLTRAGQRAFPAIRVGERWISADEADIDAALGLTPISAGVGLAPRALVVRCARMLELSANLAAQLPARHYDDPTPTMTGFVGATRFLVDGTPYVPHGTSKSLVHHIAQHGTKAWRLMLASRGNHQLGFELDGSGDYSFFGEPEPATPMYRVVSQMRLTASDMRAWLEEIPIGEDFERALETHRGNRTMAQYLKVQTVGLLQHARQLGAVLEGIGVTPQSVVRHEDMEGLNMPVGIWE